jgi:hypothetical protein
LEATTRTAREGKWWLARCVLDNPKYRGDVEYLFRCGGKEVHVVKAGQHEALV